MLALSALLKAGPSHAQEAAKIEGIAPEKQEEHPWSVLGKGGYLSPPIRGGTTPFGAGFGGAFGFTVSHIYIAASMIYFLGGTDVAISDHSLFYGLDFGYHLKLLDVGSGAFVLRPQISSGGVTTARRRGFPTA
jgi:hypothetical protein